MDEPSEFRMTIESGEKGFFLRGTQDGLVAGPKTRDIDDHITIVERDGEFAGAHRKINGREVWRTTPEGIEAVVSSFFVNNVQILSGIDSAEGTYVVSLGRVHVIVSAITTSVSLPMALFWRLICTRQVERIPTGKTITIAFDRNKIRHLSEKTRVPLLLISRVLDRTLPMVAPILLRQAAKFVLVKPNQMGHVNRGALFLISNQKVGIVWTDEVGRLLYLPLAAVLEVLARLQTALPFGSLSELGSLDWETATISGRTWDEGKANP